MWDRGNINWLQTSITQQVFSNGAIYLVKHRNLDPGKSDQKNKKNQALGTFGILRIVTYNYKITCDIFIGPAKFQIFCPISDFLQVCGWKYHFSFYLSTGWIYSINLEEQCRKVISRIICKRLGMRSYNYSYSIYTYLSRSPDCVIWHMASTNLVLGTARS